MEEPTQDQKIAFYEKQNALLKHQVEFVKNHALIAKYETLRIKYAAMRASLIKPEENVDKSKSTEEVR